MFSNPNEFSLHIEKLKIENETTYVETIVDYCERNFIDIEDVTSLINKTLKEKIAEEVNLSQSNSLDGF